jgi:hypothetical protein
MSKTKINSKSWQLLYNKTWESFGTSHDSVEGKVVTAVDSVVTGDNIPNWRKVIRAGNNATTSLVGTATHIRPGSNFAFSSRPGGYSSRFSGCIVSSNLTMDDPGSGIDSVADNQAKSRLLQSYINTRNTWRGGNFLAEVGETIHMLAHPIESFYRSVWDFAGTVKGLGKIYKKRKTSYSKALSDAWLAWSFGVSPLISDINDATSALNKLSSGFNHDSRPIKGFGRSTVVTTPPYNLDVTPGPWWANGQHFAVVEQGKRDYNVKYRGAVKAELENAGFVIDQFGVGVFDVIPAVWEAIPWSFFIDYFSNTGEMLDSLRLCSAQLSWLYRGVRNSAVVQRSSPFESSPPVNPAFQGGFSGSGSHALIVRTERTPLSSIPYPNWHFKTPNFPSLKWLNIAALARQCYGSRPTFL